MNTPGFEVSERASERQTVALKRIYKELAILNILIFISLIVFSVFKIFEWVA